LKGYKMMLYKDQLPNGATLLKQYMDCHVHLVIGYLKIKDEFVTWQVDAEGSTYSGNYFKTYLEANQDFEYRLGVFTDIYKPFELAA
jgi:hypothetical protein